jgi:hypothetical protein
MGQIRGYRKLSEGEIGLINVVKGVAGDVEGLVKTVEQGVTSRGDFGQETFTEPDPRWVAIARTHLQEGFMALTRAIAKPEGF